MRRIGVLLVLLLVGCAKANANMPQPRSSIPPAAEKYRRQLTREVRYYWSLKEPVSRFGAQVHRESTWNERAKSQAGAEGLGQIMPKTGAWLGDLYPADLGATPRPFDPWWNLRAMVMFDRRLYASDKESFDIERYAFMLARYNAGSGNIAKEQREAERLGIDRSVWGHAVETVCKRRADACKETVDYVEAILFRLEPIYAKAGW